MLFRTYDAQTNHLLGLVYQHALNEVARARPHLPRDVWPQVRTKVETNLAKAAEAGERDPQRLCSFALGGIGDTLNGTGIKRPC